ncbi:MAG: DUF2520 domain-containing protein [Proteobacteria bacterium]|nr:DUF2520 domain-containing protein [Pseudomonadota bacterium]
MKTVIIGTGRMGFVQARLGRVYGDRLIGAADRDAGARAAFGAVFGVDCVAEIGELPLGDADLVWLTVSDGQIAVAAEGLRGRLKPSCVVLHTSGALPASIICEKLPEYACGSLHPLIACPLQSVSDEAVAAAYRGVVHTVEGDADAVSVGRALVSRLDAECVEIRKGTKPLYHAGAVFASNYPLVLMDAAIRLLMTCGFSYDQALEASRRMCRQCLDALDHAPAGEALTGPVRRGDWETVRRHEDALTEMPDILETYRALKEATKRLCGRA